MDDYAHEFQIIAPDVPDLLPGAPGGNEDRLPWHNP